MTLETEVPWAALRKHAIAKLTTVTFAKVTDVTLASELTLHLEEVFDVHHHVIFILLFDLFHLPTHFQG